MTDQKIFKPEMESVEEFLARFKVQNWSVLNALKDNEVQKKAMLLACALPVDIITSITRKLKPTELPDATYEDLEKHLKALYSTKKSIVGAAVTFVSRKQQSHESIEEYSKVLNNLASACEYKSCCLDRRLRDIFIAGLRSNKIMTAIIQDCEDKSFEEVVQKSKTFEQLNLDFEEIDPSKTHSQNAVGGQKSAHAYRTKEVYKYGN